MPDSKSRIRTTLSLVEENMNSTLKIIVAIGTLLTALAMLAFTIFALTLPHFGMASVCASLTAGFSLFVYKDYQHFFGKKVDVSNKKSEIFSLLSWCFLTATLIGSLYCGIRFDCWLGFYTLIIGFISGLIYVYVRGNRH